MRLLAAYDFGGYEAAARAAFAAYLRRRGVTGAFELAWFEPYECEAQLRVRTRVEWSVRVESLRGAVADGDLAGGAGANSNLGAGASENSNLDCAADGVSAGLHYRAKTAKEFIRRTRELDDIARARNASGIGLGGWLERVCRERKSRDFSPQNHAAPEFFAAPMSVSFAHACDFCGGVADVRDRATMAGTNECWQAHGGGAAFGDVGAGGADFGGFGGGFARAKSADDAGAEGADAEGANSNLDENIRANAAQTAQNPAQTAPNCASFSVQNCENRATNTAQTAQNQTENPAQNGAQTATRGNGCKYCGGSGRQVTRASLCIATRSEADFNFVGDERATQLVARAAREHFGLDDSAARERQTAFASQCAALRRQLNFALDGAARGDDWDLSALGVGADFADVGAADGVAWRASKESVLTAMAAGAEVVVRRLRNGGLADLTSAGKGADSAGDLSAANGAGAGTIENGAADLSSGEAFAQRLRETWDDVAVQWLAATEARLAATGAQARREARLDEARAAVEMRMANLLREDFERAECEQAQTQSAAQVAQVAAWRCVEIVCERGAVVEHYAAVVPAATFYARIDGGLDGEWRVCGDGAAVVLG